MKKVVYVTGCLGFIGAYVTEACLKQGWHVIGVDKMTFAAQPERLADFETWGTNVFKFIKSDINDNKHSKYKCYGFFAICSGCHSDDHWSHIIIDSSYI